MMLHINGRRLFSIFPLNIFAMAKKMIGLFFIFFPWFSHSLWECVEEVIDDQAHASHCRMKTARIPVTSKHKQKDFVRVSFGALISACRPLTRPINAASYLLRLAGSYFVSF